MGSAVVALPNQINRTGAPAGARNYDKSRSHQRGRSSAHPTSRISSPPHHNQSHATEQDRDPFRPSPAPICGSYCTNPKRTGHPRVGKGKGTTVTYGSNIFSPPTDSKILQATKGFWGDRRRKELQQSRSRRRETGGERMGVPRVADGPGCPRVPPIHQSHCTWAGG